MAKTFWALLGAGGMALAGCSDRATDAISTPWRNDTAAMGWDLVSLFADDPERGSREWTHVYRGAEFRFHTEANRDLFALNPEAFLPEYGGYCAWAVAHDKLARGNPEYSTMLDGRLYFNFNDRTHRLWEKDYEAWLAKSERYWPGVLG